jgi:hypothetical protein
MNSCPLGGTLDCSATGALALTPDGVVTDFSANDWNSTTSKFCDAHGLDGSTFLYAGTGSTSAVSVDTTAHNLKINVMVTAAQYAGGGITFDSCVSAASFNAVQFTAAVTAGSLSGCTWQVQVQTQDQRLSTLTNPSGGTCASSCYQYPAYQIAAAPPATPMTFTQLFSAFSNPTGSTIPTRTQIVGLQWQVNSGNSGSGTCTVELRIDDIKFLTM